MFWSKIWFFLVAVAAAAALAVALVMPRPAQRATAIEETRRLTVGCGVVRILLDSDARNRVELTSKFAHDEGIKRALAEASAAAKLDDTRMKTARTLGEQVMKKIEGKRNPDLAILIDHKGRVVARVKNAEDEYGDVLAGRPLVDDALAGYLRDDLWMFGNAAYLVAASPVIRNNAYVGAVILGHKVSNEFAEKLAGKSLLVNLGFYVGTDTVAATDSAPLEQKTLLDGVSRLKGPDLAGDCSNDINTPLTVTAGADTYNALVARLPGEAGERGAYYAVFAKESEGIGFMTTLGKINKDDLGFGNFPWILLIGGFVVVLGVGIGLMLLESDRPLRRLAADAVKLAKGETERLGEDQHPGKFGSIARSVNIHIDKVGREAKSAKKDLDQLLGPAPEGSLGTIDLLATALPNARPGGAAPAAAPPPSEFKFGDSGPQPSRPTPPPRPATPPPVRAPTPLPIRDRDPKPSEPPLSLDDDILGQAVEEPPTQGADPYFKQVYDQFIAVKNSCNEPTGSLSYEKFSQKLIKNRDDLMAKTGCREVRFTVYIKEGKAALKATPVKD